MLCQHAGMVPEGYGSFFAASAGIAGALIGLLFVAVTLAPDRTVTRTAPAQNQEAAANAFLVLSNSMFISLVALLPDVNLGVACLVMAASGLVGTTVFAVNSVRQRRVEPLGSRWVVRRAMTLVILLAQAYLGLQLLAHPERSSLTAWTAGLMLAWFAIGLLRAWELIGGSTGHLSDMVRLWRHAPPEARSR